MMTGIPRGPNIPGGGRRQQKAARLKAEAEAKQRAAGSRTSATGPTPTGAGERSEGSPGVGQVAPEQTGTRGQEEAEGTGPVGQGDYMVKEGDCISSIAKDTGHFWEKIWNDPGNAELKEARKDPNVLLPGDSVTIPEVTPKQEEGETEMRHRFVRRGEPAMFRLRLLRAPRRARRGEGKPSEPQPRGNLPYSIYFDERLVASDVTDAEGKLACPIPGNVKKGKLVLEPGTPREKTYPIELGRVPPITELRGVKARLSNLGLQCNDANDDWTEALRKALRAFQSRHGLPATGEADQETRNKLVKVHGS